jgi:hypothetical protein
MGPLVVPQPYWVAHPERKIIAVNEKDEKIRSKLPLHSTPRLCRSFAEIKMAN